MTDEKDAAAANETAVEHDEHAAPDDIREQMRLALERKNSKHANGAAHTGATGNKASAATANGKRQREFRRKSGG